MLLRLLIALHTINPVDMAGQSVSFTAPCTLQVTCDDLILILPVRATHDNLNQGRGEHGLGVDTMAFTASHAQMDTFIFPDSGNIFPEWGTFYLTTGNQETAADTIRTVEPPHRTFSNTVQISIRPSDEYTGYLHELLNTPFIMAPRGTPGRNHQADDRLGTDCAGLAVYGRRRMGYDIPYAGPRGILRYLEPITEHEYRLSNTIYISQEGDTATVPDRGDILHFRSQVSIFMEDRGIPGILDTEDLLIQSWFDGPHICTLGENGFTDYPLRLYRWSGIDADS